MPCLECSDPIINRQRGARFCSPACQKMFGNRAMVRGAAFYHLIRAHRRERDKSKQLNLWTQICRLELYYNDIDAGKRTYLPPELVLSDIAAQDMIPSTNLYIKETRDADAA